jgi:hypothetical protein
MVDKVIEKPSGIKLFDDKQVRTVWDEKNEKYWFSVVDIVSVLTEQNDGLRARKYWNKLKQRLSEEGNETVTNCHQLKMPAPDGKMRLTDVADTEQILRLIQSIPSKKAEPFKLWLAKVGNERIDETIDPELSIDLAMQNYRRLGYSESWINQRIKSIEIRKDLTDEWDRAGVKPGREYADLTDLMTQTWSGMKTHEYKIHKGLKKENLRDNMTNTELVLNMLAEVATTDISKERNSQGLDESAQAAVEGASAARVAREVLEKSLGQSVISSENAEDFKRLENDKSNREGNGTELEAE